MLKLTDAVKHLIIVNVIMFIAPQFLNLDLTALLALFFPENEKFEIWQYFTHMFMHGNLQHLCFNMFGLLMIGTIVEQFLGTQRFLFLYFSAGIGAALIYTLVNYYQFNHSLDNLLATKVLTQSEIPELMDPSKVYKNTLLQNVNSVYSTPMLGASGALFGIFAAFATYFPNVKMITFPFPIPIKNYVLVLCLVISDLILGTFSIEGDNVARFAHVGGAIVGFMIAWTWKKSKQN